MDDYTDEVLKPFLICAPIAAVVYFAVVSMGAGYAALTGEPFTWALVAQYALAYVIACILALNTITAVYWIAQRWN